MVVAASRRRLADDALDTEATERRECRERPLNFQKMASGPHECAFAIRQIELDPLTRWLGEAVTRGGVSWLHSCAAVCEMCEYVE